MVKYKKILLITLMAALSIDATAQGVGLEWAKSFGGDASDNSSFISVDPKGNVITVGTYRGNLDLDPGSGMVNRTSNGEEDIFIQKLDPEGNLLWVRSIGGDESDVVTSIAVDANGSIYLCGYFSDTVDFDPGLGTFELSVLEFDDCFFLKLDENGEFDWAKSTNGGFSRAFAISIDLDGNIFATGPFQETVDFDPGPSEVVLSSKGSQDIFILKLNNDGDFSWAKSVGGENSDVGYSLTNDASGSVYLTGFYASNLDFDPGPGIFDVTVEGAGDIFIEKLDKDGEFVWVKTIGGVNNEGAYSICSDHLGDIYITGYFLRDLDFDPGLGVHNLKSIGGRDSYVLKINGDGDFIWAESFGGKLHDIGQAITSDALGEVFVTGSYSGKVDFDSVSTAKAISSSGGSDAFVVKLDSHGTVKWSKSMGGKEQDAGTSVVLDDEGNMYVTGTFGGNSDFDPSESVFELTSNGSDDIFIQKFTPWSLDINTNPVAQITKIFPNPSTGKFTLTQNTQESISITIYNAQGQVVLNQDINSRSSANEFELNEAKGLHVVKVNIGDYVETYKLLMQ